MDRIKVVLGFYKNSEFFESLDCTNMLKNWEDVVLSLERKDYTGVTKNITSEFNFVLDARDKLLEYYSEYYLSTQIKVNVYRANESFGYTKIFSGNLDFTTVRYDEYSFSINAKDNTLSSLINANKSNVYEIHTENVRADYPLKYSRINILNRVQWTMGNYNTEDNAEVSGYSYKIYTPVTQTGVYIIPLPLAYMADKTYKTPFEYKDQVAELLDINNFNPLDYPCMADIISPIPFRMNFLFKTIRVNSTLGWDIKLMVGRLNTDPDVTLNLGYGETLNDVSLNTPVLSQGGQYGIYLRVDVSTLSTIESLNFIDIDFQSYGESNGYFSQGSVAYIESMGEGKETYFKCVDIQKLLKGLVDKMTPALDVTCTIDALRPSCVLISGEDMRGIENAKIRTSFDDFASFLEACFGFTYIIEDNTIRFTNRSNAFDNTTVKTITSYSDANFQQDTGLIYNKVRVGYREYDYENTNGRNEYNRTIEYKTDLSITDNALELISPYRADSYGFEFKVQEIENEAEDKTFSMNEEDTEVIDDDIFCIAVSTDGAVYQVYRNYSLFVQDKVFSNNANIGIEALCLPYKDYIAAGIELCNYYLTKLYIDGDNAVFCFDYVTNTNTGYLASPEARILVPIPMGQSGVTSHYVNDVYIRINWNALIEPFILVDDSTQRGENITKYPVSYSCFRRKTFNFLLAPRYCASRNDFLITACAKSLSYLSSKTPANLAFLSPVGGFVLPSSSINFGGRNITCDTLTFTTDETDLPEEKNGLIAINIGGKNYQGFIISASQNIGNNEAGEYTLLLSSL